MTGETAAWLFTASAWVLPVLLGVALHEAAHGYVANWLGDPTAREAGRITLNPLRHVDPVGTILIPGLLILSPLNFVIGFAKPVPVDFGRLSNPRRDMIWVALAGPGTNILLALAAALLFHVQQVLPSPYGEWVWYNLRNGLIINLALAVFNMLPVPPLDGGRVAVGVLPRQLARPLARLEPAGIFVVLGVLFLLPYLLGRLGVAFEPAAWLGSAILSLVRLLILVTGAPVGAAAPAGL